MAVGDDVSISTASAIDLAGSEDNRRTENGKERMVESASINKSLFTLAKCVEAISQNRSRIPYRESKMTRILSLGQDNGLTVMILNLAPTRAFHLDTLSSLNFANRTKKIEIREIENEPISKGCSRAMTTFTGGTIQRQPLRPLTSTVHNVAVNGAGAASKQKEKPKAFTVYSDRERRSNAATKPDRTEPFQRVSPLKRPLDPFTLSASRPHKRQGTKSIHIRSQPAMSKQTIEDIIERKVTDILAAKALDQPSIAPQSEISEEVQWRLKLLEKKIEGKDDVREPGLSFLLCAKQHAAHGEDGSALKMYMLAKAFFPDNKKLEHKIKKLQGNLQLEKKEADQQQAGVRSTPSTEARQLPRADKYKEHRKSDHDSTYQSDGGFHYKAKSKQSAGSGTLPSLPGITAKAEDHSPGTRRLLGIINTRDVAQIRLLRGIGSKKAEGIIEAMCSVGNEEATEVRNLDRLGRLKGVGMKTVENMRAGVRAAMIA